MASHFLAKASAIGDRHVLDVHMKIISCCGVDMLKYQRSSQRIDSVLVQLVARIPRINGVLFQSLARNFLGNFMDDRKQYVYTLCNRTKDRFSFSPLSAIDVSGHTGAAGAKAKQTSQ